jgi:hypothetical protein
MAPFSFMFIALGKTTEDDVKQILADCAFGTLNRVDVADMPDGKRKFFVHYSNFTAGELRERLLEFDRRKAAGEVDVRPARIVYGEKRDGSPVYWQIFKTATPDERAKKATTAFKPRVE